MQTLTVPLGDRTYPIQISSDCLDDIGAKLKSADFPQKVALISNTTISTLYRACVTESLERHGFEVIRCDLMDGEEYKNAESLTQIYDCLISSGFDRGSGLIALGGGVIGDVAGYAAATFLRGIPYVQVPTTLLAQVDSSVGGKTAINHPLGKNLIGAFYQPQLVYIDISTLNTLDLTEVSAGLAEVVKYGMIADYEFFCWLEANADKLRNRDSDALIHAVKTSCQIKADIVRRDEKEGSIRAWLNFGHTFGHAVEQLCGYGQWKHGEAVAVGMVVAARISQQRGLCEAAHVDRLIALLKLLHLPVDPPQFTLEQFVSAMLRDKKVRRGTLTLVLNRAIGSVDLQPVDDVESVFASVLSQ